MNLNFKKMVPLKSYQNVVDQIQEAICDGVLKEGDRLPSEMKLKEMFDTSRGTIREALRVLEQKGLIVIKTGVNGGPTVREANTEPISDSIALLIQHQKVSLDQLAEFRKLMEGFISEQAASLAKKDDIAGLENILHKACDHVKTKPSGWREFHVLDAKFHQALAQIINNPLIEANLETVHNNIQIYFHQYLPFNQKLLCENLDDLVKILDAVKKGDAKTAKKLAVEHVDKFNVLMENKE